MSRSIYTVSSLVHYLKERVDHDINLQTILIKGEISNFTNHRSGHWYFTLKDAKARINCVMFASYASRCAFLLKEGMEVIVTASMTVYEVQGSVQLQVTKVQSDGLGDLYLQYEQLKKQLAREGLFDPAHKKPLPLYPEHIVLISGKEAAALQDMRNTLKRRWPLAKVSFLPSLVQGKNAAKELIETIKKADALHPDVILLARGGGSLEELWCFNDEALARCIYNCTSVLVSGVGHETDTTLVDYVSDARAATPTAAAELVTPDIKEVRHLLHVQKRHMITSMRAQLKEAKAVLGQLHANRYIHDPMLYIKDMQLRLAMVSKELEQVQYRMETASNTLQSLRQRLLFCCEKHHGKAQEQLTIQEGKLQNQIGVYGQAQEQRLRNACALLDAYSPLKILSRGYGVLYDEEHIVKSVQDIQVQDTITIRMSDGKLQANVIQKEEF